MSRPKNKYTPGGEMRDLDVLYPVFAWFRGSMSQDAPTRRDESNPTLIGALSGIRL
jgi:hypothetical protein